MSEGAGGGGGGRGGGLRYFQMERMNAVTD